MEEQASSGGTATVSAILPFWEHLRCQYTTRVCLWTEFSLLFQLFLIEANTASCGRVQSFSQKPLNNAESLHPFTPHPARAMWQWLPDSSNQPGMQ